MKGPVKVAIIGLGGRGKDTYSKYVNRFPEKMQIVAIADPIESKRKDVAAIYGIPEGKLLCVRGGASGEGQTGGRGFYLHADKMHYPHAMAALEKGYHLLLEKPVSTSAQECADIAAAAHKYNRQVQVCHVLRYTPFYQEIKRQIDSGRIGEIVTVQAMEKRAVLAPGAQLCERKLEEEGNLKPHDPRKVLPRHGYSSVADRKEVQICILLWRPVSVPAGEGARGSCAEMYG